MTQARVARQQASPGFQVHRRPNTRVLSTCQPVTTTTEIKFQQQLKRSRAACFVFWFLWGRISIYIHLLNGLKLLIALPQPTKHWDYWCVPAALVPVPFFILLLLFLQKKVPEVGKRNRSRTHLCLHYIPFSAATGHSAWAPSLPPPALL